MYSLFCCCENYQCYWPLQEHLLPLCPVLRQLNDLECVQESRVQREPYGNLPLFLWPPHRVIFVSWTIGGTKALAIMSLMVILFRVGCWTVYMWSPRGSWYVPILELKTEAQAGVLTYPQDAIGKEKSQNLNPESLSQNSVLTSLCHGRCCCLWLWDHSLAAKLYCTLGHREDVGEGADEGESWAGPTWPLGPGNLLGVEKTLGKHFEFL